MNSSASDTGSTNTSGVATTVVGPSLPLCSTSPNARETVSCPLTR